MTKKLILFLLICISAVSVGAHGYIERTDPVDGSTLSQAPTRIRVWFSEPLVPESGQISLVNEQGQSIALERVYHSASVDRLVMADIGATLPPGLYIVTASGVVVSDGHEPQGSFSFWLGSQTTESPQKPSPAYEMLILFGGVFMLASGMAYGVYQRSFLEISQSEMQDVNLD